DFERMFAALADAESLPIRGIVQLWALDKEAGRSALCGGTLQLIQALAKAQLAEAPRVCIVTRATQNVAGGAVGDARAAAPWVLLGRHAPVESARAAIEELEAKGVRVRTEAVDVADLPSLRRTMAQLRQEMPPIRGVFHAAGRVDDAMIEQQNWQRFASVMAA